MLAITAGDKIRNCQCVGRLKVFSSISVLFLLELSICNLKLRRHVQRAKQENFSEVHPRPGFVQPQISASYELCLYILFKEIMEFSKYVFFCSLKSIIKTGQTKFQDLINASRMTVKGVYQRQYIYSERIEV